MTYIPILKSVSANKKTPNDNKTEIIFKTAATAVLYEIINNPKMS